MPDVKTILKDPEFYKLPEGERIKVMQKVDNNFAGLPQEEQVKAIGMLSDKFLGSQNSQSGGFSAGVMATPKSYGDTRLEMMKNIPASAVDLAKNTYQAVTHPVESIKNVGRVVSGGMESLIGKSETSMPEDSAAFEQFKSAIGERYGSLHNAAVTLEKDPVGFLVDMASVFTVGGKAISTLPGKAGEVGQALKTASQLTEPVSATSKITKYTGKTVSKITPKMMKDKFSPEGLYASAMKFSNNPKVLTPIERRKAIATGLSEKMLPNEESYIRLWNDVNRNKSRVTNIIEKGKKAGDTISTQESLRFLDKLEQRANLIKKSHPEFSDIIQEAREGIKSYGDSIPVESAQVLKETLQDLSKYATDDRSKFMNRANKAVGRGVRIQLEQVYPELKGLNAKSSSLLDLENELAKAVGRVGNRDIANIGIRFALGGTPGITKSANLLSSIFDLPKVKAKLAIAIYEGKTGIKLPPSKWKVAAKIIAGQESRLSAAQAGKLQNNSNNSEQ